MPSAIGASRSGAGRSPVADRSLWSMVGAVGHAASPPSPTSFGIADLSRRRRAGMIVVRAVIPSSNPIGGAWLADGLALRLDGVDLDLGSSGPRAARPRPAAPTAASPSTSPSSASATRRDSSDSSVNSRSAGRSFSDLQPEELEKVRGRSVKKGPPRLVLLAEDANQIALEEELECRSAVDSSDLVDLRARDRLPVRCNRKRFDLGARQLDRALARELPDERRELNARPKEPTARNLVEHDPASRVVRLQLAQERSDLLERRRGHLGQLTGRHGLVGREDERLEEASKMLACEIAGLLDLVAMAVAVAVAVAVAKAEVEVRTRARGLRGVLRVLARASPSPSSMPSAGDRVSGVGRGVACEFGSPRTRLPLLRAGTARDRSSCTSSSALRALALLALASSSRPSTAAHRRLAHVLVGSERRWGGIAPP